MQPGCANLIQITKAKVEICQEEFAEKGGSQQSVSSEVAQATRGEVTHGEEHWHREPGKSVPEDPKLHEQDQLPAKAHVNLAHRPELGCTAPIWSQALTRSTVGRVATPKVSEQIRPGTSSKSKSADEIAVTLLLRLQPWFPIAPHRWPSELQASRRRSIRPWAGGHATLRAKLPYIIG